MKRRQKDFDKVALRVGKTLPKKKNETNTTIKKRKLQLPTQKFVKKSALSCEDYVKIISQGNVRDDDLKHLKNMILKQGSTFSHFLSEILNKMTKIILDNNLNKSLRDNALKVIITLLEQTNDAKISSFFPLFINVISCAITSSNDEIKNISLELVDTLLKTHPNLICCSVITFSELLTFLSGQLKKAPTIRTRQTDHNVADAALGKIVKILSRLNKFLKVILKNEANKKFDNEDYIEIYWDCKSPLYLQLYAGGSVKPFDIEKFYSSNFNWSHDFKDPLKMKELLKQFMPLCSEIFIEFSEDSSSASDALVSNDTIKKLSVLFDFLSNFGEWIKLLNNSELAEYFSKIFSKEMLKHLVKFPFSFREASINLKKQEKRLPSVQLNLSICYLYSTFILGTDYCTGMLKDQVFFDYLNDVQNMSDDIQNAVIPILLKIANNYVHLKDTSIVNEFVDKILPGLCELFGTDDSPNQKLLASFLVQVSVDPDYRGIIECKAMKIWFSRLLDYLVKMARKGNVDKNLLNNIKKIAHRKHEFFLDSLDEMPNQKIIELFKHSNDDVKDTAIFLIINMENINSDLLEKLSDVILTDTTFPLRIAARLIRLLTYRFSKERVKSRDRVRYIRFLVNLAIDFSSLQNANYSKSCPPEYLKAWEPCEKYFTYTLLPSLQWKRHLELFEVCFISLAKFPQFFVNKVIMVLIMELLKEFKSIPVHSAIAMLRLHQPEKMKGSIFRCHIQDFIYCILVFISVYTTLPVEDDWYFNNVTELMNSFDITRSVAVRVVEQLDCDSSGVEDGIVAYYLLRVIRFLLKGTLLQEDDRDNILKILDNMKENCKQENLEQQTLFIKLMNCFGYFG